MVNGLAVVVMMGLIALGAGPRPAEAQALDVTFLCPNANGTTCTVPDSIRTDAPLSGYQTWTIKKTTYIDGAFINSAGGIDINLLPPSTAGDPSPDHSLIIDFGGMLGNGQDACHPASATITATQVDFRFNVTDGSAQGIGLLPANGGSATGDSGGLHVIGIVNFAMGNGATGALFFNHTQDSVAAWDGLVTLTRTGSVYELESNSMVLLQCTLTGKGRPTTYNMGPYLMPFRATFEAPAP